MAYDSEELDRRRQQRIARQRQRQAQQKKLRTQLIIAAGVLAVCALVILMISQGGFRPGDTPATVPQLSNVDTTPTQTVPTTPPTTKAEEEPYTVIHLAAAGDLNINDATVAAGGAGQNYTEVFMDVLPLLSQADLTTINFEGNLVGAPYGTGNVSAPQSMMTALANLGVDLVQMANSKAINNGVSGLEATLNNIRAAGLEPVGAYASNAEFRQSGGYTIREVKGIRIAFVAFTKGMDSIAIPAGSEDCINLLYTDYSTTYSTVDRDGITDILEAVEDERPDITIALLHWGSEYNDMISDTQDTIRGIMMENGVDVIIGTHPHYVQAMEFDEEAGTFICYSLGDFYSDARLAGTEYSVILDLEITKDNELGETKVTGYSYTPIFTVAERDTLRVVRIEDAMKAYELNHYNKVSDETYADMVYALERIAQRVIPVEDVEED